MKDPLALTAHKPKPEAILRKHLPLHPDAEPKVVMFSIAKKDMKKRLTLVLVL